MSTASGVPARHGRLGSFGHFVLRVVEMCMPMCMGWALGAWFYVAVAEPLGSSEPFPASSPDGFEPGRRCRGHRAVV
jgi:hypothetical protein